MPEELQFWSVIKGSEDAVAGEKVMKIGRSTRNSQGVISKTLAFIYHKNMGCMFTLGHVHSLACNKGDSGSLLN